MSDHMDVSASIFIRCPQCLGEVPAIENDLPASSPFRCRSCRQRQSDIARRFYAQDSAVQMKGEEDAIAIDNDSPDATTPSKGAKRNRASQPSTES